MAEHRKLSETSLKDEEESAIKRNIDNSEKNNFVEEDVKIYTPNVDFGYTLKRYSMHDLLSLRNAPLSIHYPHCAIRPELQVLSVWTCRLRCELQYLGLWKIPNAGNAYGNCNCNGSCQSYSCDGQQYPFSNSQINSGNSQICYANVQNAQQVQSIQSSSPTSISKKKAERSRERLLSYQRCINSELTRATSPTGEREGLLQHHLNPQTKPAFIDHRSISSSHLMPAFAKRRMGHTLHVQQDAGGHNTEHLSHDGGLSENSNLERPRKESLKSANDQNDYNLFKASVKSRMVKSDRINSDFTPSNNKINAGSVNKKLLSERRIGSGRLIPREVNLDMRTGGKKRLEKEVSNTVNNNGEKDKDILARGIDKISNRNSSIGRFSDPQTQELRIFDRRITNSEDSNNSGSSNRNKRYNTTNPEEDKNSFEMGYQTQTPHFTSKRSISFRRREYIEPKDYHRDFFRERKGSGEGREREDEHRHHFYHRDNKEEPEWFSEGPTSQHETIELRGFEETDDSQREEEHSSEQYSKIEKMSSGSSLLSINSSSNVNLATKNSFDISNDMFINSNVTTLTNNNDVENDGGNVNIATKVETKTGEKKEDNELKTEMNQIISKTEDFDCSDKRRLNATDLFIDNFLNIEGLENSLINSGNDQSSGSFNDGGGTSRFSRWFFNNSNNVNSTEGLNNNLQSKEESKQHKDLNESDFNSFMSFFKCNNYGTPELPKGLPSNVSALSVEELEARMRKVDAGEIEKAANSEGGQNLHKNALSVEELESRMRKLETYEMETAKNSCDSQNLLKNDEHQTKKTECQGKPDVPPQSETNTQDIEAFRKLLDQLGKPPVDISMNITLPASPGQPQSLKSHIGPFPTAISQMPQANSLPQINMPKQEYAMPNMHQQQPILHRQQNMGKMLAPHFQHQYPHAGISENMPLMSLLNHSHTHHMPMMVGQPQKRLDVQHLIQSVIRGELSRSFLEKELNNRNISPYNKEIISTVLNETARYNLNLAAVQNVPDSIGVASNNDASVAPNNLMQSLARGEVSLNFVEHELNKLNNMNILNDASVSGAFKARSRCGTPLTSSLNVASISTSGNMTVPLSSQVVVPRQEQSSILASEAASSDQQQHQTISSMYRSNYHDTHTQAMQNAMFKKKLEIEQHEALRRRQENFKQQKHEPEFISQLHQQQSLISSSSLTQQGHQQSSKQMNNPTPLAFMPTSVLRKMTAEKEPITNFSHASTLTSSSTQQMQPHLQQPHLQQPHLKIPSHPQMYQHSNQPRIILGRGNFQYMHQQQPQIPPAVNDNSQFLHNKNLNYAINGHF